MLACTELIPNYYNLTNMKKENLELIKSKTKWQQQKWHKIETLEALPYIFFIHDWMMLGHIHVLVKTKQAGCTYN